jgi:hypothetical protein
MTRLRAWLAVWTGWTALALFFAVSTSLTYRSTGRPANWRLTITRALSEWWGWALLTPLIAWLSHRFPLHGIANDSATRCPCRRGDRHGRSPRWSSIARVRDPDRVLDLHARQHARAQLRDLSGHRRPPHTVSSTTGAAASGISSRRGSPRRGLQLLGMQLQPHFLFNTLNTIAEMVHEDPDKADAMIGGLSDLLRRTLELGSSPEITLEEELVLAERYLDIQRARFGDRLRVTRRGGCGRRGGAVPALLLQPLVENAIRHGLALPAATPAGSRSTPAPRRARSGLPSSTTVRRSHGPARSARASATRARD